MRVTRQLFDKCWEKSQRERLDIHRTVAAEIFGVKYDDVTHTQRACAKSENYIYLYSHGPMKMESL